MKINPFSANDIKLIKRTVKYILQYKVRFIISFLCILTDVLFGIISPLIWAKLITALFTKDFNSLKVLILYQIILYILQNGVKFLQAYLFNYLNENIIYNLKSDVFKKILELPVKAFDEMRIGDFITRLHGDITSIKAIENLVINHTLIIITHKISSVIDADKIILVDDGKVLCEGIHEYMISENEKYRSLFNSEFELVEADAS